MWSLVDGNQTGVNNRTEALPMVIDAQYHVGYSWARQSGFRVTKNFGNKIWLACRGGKRRKRPDTSTAGTTIPPSATPAPAAVF